MEGWITLERRILGWQWYTDVPTKTLFVHLLLNANHKANPWRGIVIERGQLVTGRKALAEETGLSEKQIRTALQKLSRTKEISIKTASKFSVITICKYDDYQSEKKSEGQQRASKGPARGQQRATNNNDNNDNNENKIGGTPPPPAAPSSLTDRKIAFGEQLEPFAEQYGRPTLHEFYNYWTEISDGQKKMRFEKQDAFEVSKRLATWKKKDEEFKALKVKPKPNVYQPGKFVQ